MAGSGTSSDGKSMVGRWARRVVGCGGRTGNSALGRRGQKILTTGAAVSAVLLSLTGGLALVVRSLRNTDLSLSLSLTRSPDGDERSPADSRAGDEASGRTYGSAGRRGRG